MQYYKGNALENEATEKEVLRGRTSFFHRIGKGIVYPFVLIFWLMEELIYKSVEEDH